MSKQQLPSIDLVLDETRKRLDLQFEQINNLDTKASIALAASGVVLAAFLAALQSETISDIRNYLCLTIIVVTLILSALAFAVVGLWIKKYERPPKPERLRDYYIVKDDNYTKLHIIDAGLEAIEYNHSRLVWKIRVIKFSFVTLSIGVAILAVLILLAVFV